MKKILFLLLLIPFFTQVKAQDVVYLTYDDFLHNKYIQADFNSMTWWSGTTNRVSLKENGEKKSWKTSEIALFKLGKNVWRCVEVGHYHVAQILLVGNYVLYGATYETSNGGQTTLYLISKDLNSQTYRISNMRDVKRLADEDKDFKELGKCYTSDREKHAMDIIIEFIKKSKEYKPLEEVFPLLKNSK